MSYYLILDLGTTTIKAFAFDENGEILKERKRTAKVISPEPGWVEEDPVKYWETTRSLIDEIVNELGTPVAIGITNQRTTTIVWDKTTGEPLYNMITWQDTRAGEIAEEYSRKSVLKIARFMGKFVGSFAKLVPSLKRKKSIIRALTLANFKFGANQSIMHVRWLLDNNDDVKKAVRENKAAFGTVDSWIVWNMTKQHVTDYTNASATGLFDPFNLEWSNTLLKIVNIPTSILPQVKDSMADFGEVTFLKGVHITAVIADQQASLFSAGGTNIGTMKITNGTGSFIDINVGSTPVPGLLGTYPMIALKWKDEVYYLLEGIVQASGSVIDWLVEIGLAKSPEEVSEIASKTRDSAGVIFVPTICGLGTPFWNARVRGIIYGIMRATTKNHLIRAAIEGIAARCAEVILLVEEIAGIKVDKIIADGNVSRCDALLQFLANFTGKKIIRPRNLEGTARGAFLLARGGAKGLSLKDAWIPPTIEKQFDPVPSDFGQWKKVLTTALSLSEML